MIPRRILTIVLDLLPIDKHERKFSKSIIEIHFLVIVRNIFGDLYEVLFVINNAKIEPRLPKSTHSQRKRKSSFNVIH